MRHLGYNPCKGDGDLWMKPMVQPEDNHAYYAYMLLYVDDALAIHHDATATLEQLDHYFQMKPGSIRDLDIYLGAKLWKATLENGVEAWSLSSSRYVQDAVKNAEENCKKFFGHSLLNKASAPWLRDYVSELD